jgi:peptidoglycan hydrolase-like protein with peptidoglycan-binding domain
MKTLHAGTALLLCVVAACSGGNREARERQAAKEIRESIKDVEAIALEQNASPEVIKEAQQHLTALKEYQGEVNGKLDSVTVNSIQAFQRSAGIEDDGILNEKTRLKLAQTAPAS